MAKIAIFTADKVRPGPLAWATLPIFIAAIAWLWHQDVQTAREAPDLLIILNLLLTTAPWLAIAVLFLRSFLITGAPGVVLFGCGASLWSFSGLAPLALVRAPGAEAINATVTLHNLMVWAASLCCLAGAALIHLGWPPVTRRVPIAFAAYALALFAAAFMAFTTLEGWTAAFFVQGEGATLERQFVLASTIFAILLTLSMLRNGITLRSPFLDWFALALMLLAIGYAGLMLQTNVGGVLGWASRAAQYCGGGYMLMAARVALRDKKPAFALVPFRHWAPHRYSIALAIVLGAAVLLLVFLQAIAVRFGFITFYPAVMLAALYGGYRSGVLATLSAAALSVYFWVEPARSFAVASALDWVALAIFLANCFLVSWIVDLLQRAQMRLRLSEAGRRAELERLVADRTAELGLVQKEVALANEAKSSLLAAATATEAELQAVLDSVPAGIWIARDQSYKKVQANRLAATWMRVPEGANASRSAPSLLRFEIFDKDGRPVPNDQLPLRRAAAGEEVTDYEFQWRFPDGDRRFLHGNATPLRNPDGSIAGGVAAFIDITERKRAEEALRSSEERYRTLVQATSAVTWSCPPSGLHVVPQPLWMAFTGQTAEEVLGDGWTKVVHPEDASSAAEQWSNAIAREKPLVSEVRIRRHDGSWRWMSCHAVPIRDGEGKIVEWFGMNIDITERKQADAALRESEARLRAVLDSSPDPIFLKDRENRLLLANPATFAVIGKPAEACLGKTDEEYFYSPDDGRAVMANDRRIMASGEAETVEETFRMPSGARCFVSHKAPFRDSAGNIIGVIGVANDITERKQAEYALRESEERFRGIFQHAGTAISITDLDGHFQSCNPALTATLGYTEQELLGRNFQELVHPDDREENAAVAERLRAQEIPSFELLNRYVRKDGGAVWVHKRVSLLRDATGKPTHFIALVTDMTERKRYEEHINLLMREVNHRAKNMLSVVQAIARQTAATNAKDFVECFGDRVRALAASQDLLVRAEWRGVDLEELVRAQLAHFGDLIGARIDLSGPRVFISASAAQTIGMALHELSTNAGKYGALSTVTGRVEVAWSLRPGEDGSERFTMRWSESGGPPVTNPGRAGFGTTVISKMVRMSLDADVDLDLKAEGLVWRFDCQSDNVLERRRP